MLGGLLAGAAAPALAARDDAPRSAQAALNALLDRILQEDLRASPETASSLGLDVGPLAPLRSRLDGRSLAARDGETRKTADQLARLMAFEARGLAPRDRVNLEAVRATLAARQAIAGRFAYGAATAAQPFVVSHLGGAYSAVPELLETHHPVNSKADADAYLERLDQFAVELRAETARLQHDAALGVTPPDFILDRTLEQLAQLMVPDGAAAELATAIGQKAAKAGLAGDYKDRATAVLTRSVLPALAAQAEQLKAMRTRSASVAGVWRLPDGEAYYATALQTATTTKDDAEMLHRLGRALAEELGAALDTLLAAQGYTQGERGERLSALQRDPRHAYPNTEAGKTQLMSDVVAKLDEVRSRLPRIFHRPPKTPVDVRRVPAFLEAGAPFAHYQDPSSDGARPGIFYINLRDTAEVPRWLITTTAFHEALPGHHLQQVVLQEGPSLPLIRTVQWSPAYGEGWGLYAEQLADELGMYEHDPVGRIGYLLARLLRAARLVVDTGVHAKRWTRAQAVAWMTQDCGFAAARAVNEVERYCVWPGQACSYMVGAIAWNRLRDRARRDLGSRFDIRDFHQAGLEVGAVPLTVLDDVVERYIAAAKAV